MGANQEYSEDECIKLIQLRHFQHQINEMLKAGKFNNIPIHLAFGHEAVAIGVHSTMQGKDNLCLTHRNIAYNLAGSKSLYTVLQNYCVDPLSNPKMASMNLACQDSGVIYSSSILGNNFSVASGIAMNRKLNNKGGVIFAVSGDGAIEEGAFWEALIFASSHSLKMVFIVENNNYSMSSTIVERRSPINLSLVCLGLGIAYENVNGVSLHSVKKAVTEARFKAQDGVVALLEMQVKTFCQHAGPTPGWPGDPLSISMQDGMIINDDPLDPLKELFQSIGPEKFDCALNLVNASAYL